MSDQFNNPIQGYEGWNVNAPYLSPAYMANFRPAYNTEGSRENPFARRDTIAHSAWTLGPGDYEYGSDATLESSAHIYNITTGAGDAITSLIQNVGIPLAAWYGVEKFNKATKFGSYIGSAMGQQGMRGATGVLGRVAAAVGMGGVASSGAAGTAARSAARAAGGLGGLAGGMFLPIMAAQAVASVANPVLFDPIVSTRRGMDAMRANTAHQFIDGDGQNRSEGFGMSATRAQEISQALTEAGQGDESLSGGKYNEIADNMMRAGIFQEVGDMDADRIVEGVKKATSVLKLISRITGNSDILAGIQTLATLKAGGIDDIGKMEIAVAKLNRSAAASGIGVEQLMDTIGNQGMLMAQQQGLTGHTGLMASTDAFAGFTNARRAGIISGGQMQALGGAEGMTQNLMSGAYKALDSGYGRMAMQGRTGFGSSVVDVIGGWSRDVSTDPLSSQGDWFTNQGAYKEQAMRDQNPSTIALEKLQSLAENMGMDPNDGTVLGAMAQYSGMSSEEFRSIAESDRALQSATVRHRRDAADRTADRSSYASSLQQDYQGMRGVPILGPLQEFLIQTEKAVLTAGAEFVRPVGEKIASASDFLESTLAEAKGMTSIADISHMVDLGEGAYSQVELKGYDKGLPESDHPSSYGQLGVFGELLRQDSDLIESDSQDKLKTKINELMLSSNKDTAKKTSEAVTLLASKNKEAFIEMIPMLDKDGLLSGEKEGSWRKEAEHARIAKLVRSGELQAKFTDIQSEYDVRRTLDADINDAMRYDYSESAVEDIMIAHGVGTGFADPEFLQTLGLEQSELDKFKTKEEKKKFVDEKIQDYYLRDMEDIEGSESDRRHTFFEQLARSDYSPDLIKRFVNKKMGGNLDEYLNSKQDPVVLNRGDELRKFEKGIYEFRKEEEADAKNKGTDAKWDNLIDVTDGIGKLMPVMTDNTTAIEANTQALNIANLGNRSDLQEIGGFVTNLFGKNDKEAVVNSVPNPERSSNVPSYYR